MALGVEYRKASQISTLAIEAKEELKKRDYRQVEFILERIVYFDRQLVGMIKRVHVQTDELINKMVKALKMIEEEE